jgi:cell division septation protein DedD
MVWTFILGIVVGRGLSPVRFDVQVFKKKLIAEKEKAVQRDEARFKIESENLAESPDLDFFTALKEEKEETPPKAEDTEVAHANPPVKTSQVVKPKNQLIKPKRAIPAHSRLTIQVASLKNDRAANALVARLKKMRYEAYTVTASLPGNGTYHRVRVGHFTNPTEARQVAALLREDDFEAVVIEE